MNIKTTYRNPENDKSYDNYDKLTGKFWNNGDKKVEDSEVKVAKKGEPVDIDNATINGRIEKDLASKKKSTTISTSYSRDELLAYGAEKKFHLSEDMTEFEIVEMLRGVRV